MKPNSNTLHRVSNIAILCAALLPAFGVARGAVTIDFTAGPGERSLITSTGSPVPDGNLVHVGSFATLFDVQANAGSIGSLWSSFNVLGTTTVRTILGDPGRFGATTASSDSAFDGRQIYMLVMMTVNQAAPTPSFDNLLEYGLFTNSGSGDWLVPAQGAAVPSTLVGSSQVATAEFGNLSANSLALGLVPEPSTGLLLALGLIALAFRSRHRVSPSFPSTTVAMGLALFVSSGLAQASVTIDYTAQLGQRNVTDADGGLLRADSGEVRLGTLAEFFDPDEHGDDLHRLREAWIPLDATPIRSVLGEASRFSAAVTSDDASLESGRLFLWILKTSDGADVAPDYSNVTDFGLYSSTGENWTVPSEERLPPENTTIINSSQIDLSYGPASATDTSLRLTRLLPVDVGYDEWARDAFPEGTAEEDRLPDANPDGDSLSNLLELFTGNDPAVADPQTPFQLAVGENGITFAFERSRSAPAGAASVQSSFNLTQWTEEEMDPEALQISPVVGDPSVDRVEITIPFDEAAEETVHELYLRLSVEG